MSWNWSIFVFTRIYNCLTTSSPTAPQFSASDWSAPLIPGLWLADTRSWPPWGEQEAVSPGPGLLSPLQFGLQWRGNLSLESEIRQLWTDSSTIKSSEQCCWCWQCMRKRWCWRCWCDDEMRRDDLTAADGSRPVWDDILMWYPHIIQSNMLIMKCKSSWESSSLCLESSILILVWQNCSHVLLSYFPAPDDRCCSISQSGHGG